MPERRRAGAAGPGAADRRTRRGGAVAVASVALLIIGALVFSAVYGFGSGDTTGERPPRDTRPSPSPTRPWDRTPESIAAVGDSITQGFDACSLLADCARASWVTGSDTSVRSLATRLIDRAPQRRSWNFAVSGSVMAGLPEQMERAARKRPDLVTVLTGANDACRPSVGQMTPVESFRADFRAALRTLREAQPKTHVYVSSVPDLKRLWSQGRDEEWARRVWRLGICQSMLRDPLSSSAAAEARRQQVHERVRAYNTVLEEECRRHPRCRYDGGAVFRYRFTGNELSRWDWFHPSKAGQRKLAEIAYRRITARQEDLPR